MNGEKRIMLLTLSFGSGHIRAAQSVVAELQNQMPEADLKMIDALEGCKLFFRVFYVWTYWWLIRYAPRLWNKFFRARLERRDEQTAPVRVWRKGCPEVFENIRRFQPDLIVACEVGASEIAVIARRAGLTNAEIVNVITDFEAEPIWVKPEITAFSIPNNRVAEQLQNWGAKPEKIKVCGIPLDASFSKKHDTETTRGRFNLDERPIVLLMGGGMGPTRMSEVAERLVQTGVNLQIVALPAKDEKAKAELEKLQNTPTVSLHVVGWTNFTAELMQAADVLATKPGGLTLSEAAACGLPMVLFDAIPGPEEENAKLFAGQGAGIKTRGSEETAFEILRLLENPRERRQMSANVRKLARTDASEKIVNLILETLDNLPAAGRILSPPKKLSTYRKMYGAWRKLKRRKIFFERKTADLKNRKSDVIAGKSVMNIEAK
jgi:processive 1,2-diacylglycerol beta-glucosyltransferase